jgi:hypothetical protein
LRFETEGNVLRLSFKGTTLLTAVDGSLPGPGLAGLRGSAGAVIDNLLISPVAPTLPVNDSFNRANNTRLGNTWAETVGDVSVQGNRMIGSQALNLAVDNRAAAADMCVQADVRLPGTVSGHAGLLVRYTGPGDTNAYLGALAVANGTYTASIWRNIAGTWTKLNSTKAPTGTGTLRFEALGNSLRLFLSGTLLLAVRDSTLTGPGLVGIRGSAGVTYDNVSAWTVRPALPFADGFFPADTTNLGGNYLKTAGNLAIRSGKLTAIDGGVNLAVYTGASSADVRLQTDVALPEGSTVFVGLVARYCGPGDTDMYLGELSSSGSVVTASLWRNWNGTWTQLVSAPVTSASGTLRFEVLGQSLSLYLDDVLVAATTDNLIRGPGMIGIRGSANATWDNLLADILGPRQGVLN